MIETPKRANIEPCPNRCHKSRDIDLVFAGCPVELVKEKTVSACLVVAGYKNRGDICALIETVYQKTTPDSPALFEQFLDGVIEHYGMKTDLPISARRRLLDGALACHLRDRGLLRLVHGILVAFWFDWATETQMCVVASVTSSPSWFALELVSMGDVYVSVALRTATRLLESQERPDTCALISLTCHLLQCNMVGEQFVFDHRVHALDTRAHIHSRKPVDLFPDTSDTVFWRRLFSGATTNGTKCMLYSDARLIMNAVCVMPDTNRLRPADLYILTLIAMNYPIEIVSPADLYTYGIMLPRLTRSLCFPKL